MRMRKKPNLAPRMEKCGHLLLFEPAALRGQWLTEFTQYGGMCLELGCGKGRFTVETALAEPDTLFIAMEKSANAMITALERAGAAKLNNVRFINALADDVTDYFAPGEVLRLYINFCDPWPARRHEKRRLTAPCFLEKYKKILTPGGEIRFKTDNAPLFDYSLRELDRNGFTVVHSTRDLHSEGSTGVMTDYEQKFHTQGIPICACTAQLL